MGYTAHMDTFARDNLPPRDQWPDLIFEIPDVHYPERINCAEELLDSWIERGAGYRIAFRDAHTALTYEQVCDQVNQIAHVLVEDMGLVPGNRILLRGPNNVKMAMCWLAVIKAGLIAVTTMPLLRAKELSQVIEKAQVTAALCDARFDQELIAAQEKFPILRQIVLFNDHGTASLESRMASKPTNFNNVETAADDVALIAFTSGTTGKPKGTMHFHRDVLAICDCFPKYTAHMTKDDVCIGTPPLAFTFGLGGILLFPLRFGASTVLMERLTPDTMLQAIQDYRATITWTAPTFYRQMAPLAQKYDLSSLKKCVSAGEALPTSTRTMWREATGIEMIDGIGATELLHIFISAADGNVRPGATGKPVPGYQACVVDDEGNPCPPGTVGRLAVKGPTGCRYLADPRQKTYVENGWNLTGDAYMMDADGYFWYQARTDDIIITAGYNVAGPEVEDALLQHPAVAECAVVGAPDEDRGHIIKAFIVLRPGHTGDANMVKMLQEFVKLTIAPYKYPRAIEFCEALPRTETGKLQRFRLRQQEADKAKV
ncbi:MAG: benzoate-CoA ligase family protein [Anaerolineae bacterium]|nr:benzoate-CoA ligase family protein [Anaerolineae bacterium]